MRKIKVIITIDDNGGLMFNKRRQSRDRVLIDDMCKSINEKIHMNAYSAQLFDAYLDKICIFDNPLKDCPDGGYVFLEGTHIGNYMHEIDELIVYHWNKLYPSDMRLDINIENSELKLYNKYDFAGSSHDKITKGIYKK